MRKTFLLSYVALGLAAVLPAFVAPVMHLPIQTPKPTTSIRVSLHEPKTTAVPASIHKDNLPPALSTVTVLTEDGIVELEMEKYLLGVVAAEMPASFHSEALKAQAVAARTYTMYCAAADKHGKAQVCTDYSCCQAWISEEQMQSNWGEDYEQYRDKVSAAIDSTAGQYLIYGGEPVFAAFHSSSAGATEDCGQVWNTSPYLISVSSPETAEDVPNYISTVQCSALDFRDTVLYAYPETDFTGAESEWIGEITRDNSGRVSDATIGGTRLKGTKVRSLFKLRSTAFELTYDSGIFTFTVTGFGHGVGMSQYGANVMAENGADYKEILAHYYPATLLSRS